MIQNHILKKTVLTTFFTLISTLGIQAQTETDSISPQPAPLADYIISGGSIYTAEDANPMIEAVAVQGDTIIFAGNVADAQVLVGPNTEMITLNGATLFPGFVDAHAHLSSIGVRELLLNLEGAQSLTAFKEGIKRYAAGTDAAVITGRGWIETHWPEGRFPTRWDIDEVVSDRPVILGRADGHALVANSAAIEAAGITGETQAPSGGDILKNALGEPTGVFVDAAMPLVRAIVPAPTRGEVVEQLTVGARVYADYGWTGLHNMSVSWQEVEILEEQDADEKLPIRVYNSINANDAGTLFANGASASSNGKVVTRAIKLYMDGALGSRGAALLEPYSDAQTLGLVLSDPSVVKPLLQRALRAGVQINMHAIGDRGNRQLLDWFQEAFERVPASERAVAVPRWRDEHTQIVNPDDMGRFAELGVIPSMQPSHAIGDLHFAADRLGDDRLNGAYPWASLLATGVIIAGGSDAPVERGDPLIEFYAATARRDLNGFQGDDWHPEEALSRQQTLKMFTLWPAVASFAEDSLGSIAVGKKADFTAFDTNLMTADETDIPKGKAVLTIVGGKIAMNKLGETPE